MTVFFAHIKGKQLLQTKIRSQKHVYIWSINIHDNKIQYLPDDTKSIYGNK